MDCITKEEALEMLSKNVPFRKEREEMIKQKGYPAYTTAVGLDLHFNLNIFYYEIISLQHNIAIQSFHLTIVGWMARLLRRKNCKSL